MGNKDALTFQGFYRQQPSSVTTTEGWTQLPGRFPAGGDTPSEDPFVAAAALLARDKGRVKKMRPNNQGLRRIEVMLFDSKGESHARILLAETREVIEFEAV